MKYLFILVVLFTVGCAQSTSTMRWHPTDPNNPFEFTGKAADMVAEKVSATLAQNTQTQKGRENALFENLKQYAGWLFLAFVGGLVFWGFTRSKFGWVIPAASIGGLALITFWGKFSTYIAWGVMLVAIALLVWKATEYQKERNTEILKQRLGENKNENH